VPGPQVICVPVVVLVSLPLHAAATTAATSNGEKRRAIRDNFVMSA
jgi:hypothetical protein